MAYERNRWLDRAAAERVLRGGPVVPVGDRRAREAEARLRTALEALAEPQSPAGVELPGEAAAVAAFRAARGGAAHDGASEPAEVAGPVMELGPVVALTSPLPVSASRRSRPVRFGLAAALAGVAVGGLAAAAGAGLLDRATHDTAGPAPAVSLSTDENPTSRDTAGPTPGREPRPTPLRGGDGSSPTPGSSLAPGAQAGASQGSGTGGAGTGTGPGTWSGGAAGTTGTDGKETFGGGTTELKDRQNRLKAVDLCKAYRSGQITSDRRDRLSKLADGLSRIPYYCETVLDRQSGYSSPAVPRTSDDGSDVLKAPTLTPASPGASAGTRLPH
ncbi:hypothetical protein ABZZ20_03505 [Streptomyces sp. NPDC006430]|uniref:hypothetical protein n=1 Tax=Streptomyces sp. NPDC006430 TaxID=3154299 RepID=UPI0033B9F6B6